MKHDLCHAEDNVIWDSNEFYVLGRDTAPQRHLTVFRLGVRFSRGCKRLKVLPMCFLSLWRSTHVPPSNLPPPAICAYWSLWSGQSSLCTPWRRVSVCVCVCVLRVCAHQCTRAAAIIQNIRVQQKVGLSRCPHSHVTQCRRTMEPCSVTVIIHRDSLWASETRTRLTSLLWLFCRANLRFICVTVSVRFHRKHCLSKRCCYSLCCFKHSSPIST